MDANFFYYSIYDIFIQRQKMYLHACVCAFVNFFLQKNFSETIDWTFTELHSSVP